MADRVPIRSEQQVLEDTKASEPRVIADAEVSHTAEHFDEVLKERMANAIDEELTKESSERLQKVLQWAKSRGAKEPEQVMWEFRHLIRQLGAPRMGENRLSQVYRYIVLDSTANEVQSEMIEMEA